MNDRETDTPTPDRIDDDRFDELCVRYYEGGLDADEVEELDAALRDDAARREVFVTMAVHGAMIRSRGAAATQLADADAPPMAIEIRDHDAASTQGLNLQRAHGGRTRSNLFRYSAAAVLLLTIGLTVAMMWSPSGMRDDHAAGADAPDAVATLTNAAHAEWDTAAGDMLDTGMALEPGRLQLRAGSAEVLMQSTAVVTLLGPADVEMLGPNRCRLNRGRIIAAVPPSAHGFTVETPTQTVVDLGTNFGVEVDATNNTRVHVFEGRVEVYPTGKPVNVTQLDSGEARYFARDRAASASVVSDPALFDWMLAPANPGAGLRVGDREVGWWIVGPKGSSVAAEAMSVEPDMKYIRGGSASSWWVSLPNSEPVASDSVWTFETRFEIDRDDVNTLGLNGRFSVDNQVIAIRVNGRSVPLQTSEEKYQHAVWAPLAIPPGMLVSGENVVQFDVYNASSVAASPVALRLEWSFVPSTER